MQTTRKVRVWKISVYKGKRRTTYTVRWWVNGKEFRETFSNDNQADAFRSELVTATREGKRFNVATGLPVMHESRAASTNWYDFAVQFVDAKWPRVSANNRKTIAKVLMSTTVALLRRNSTQFDPVEIRTALREYAFNRNRRDEASAEVRAILSWVQRNTFTMAAWEDAEQVDTVLDAIALKLDGTPVAASTVKRNRRVLIVAMECAVTRHILSVNPLPKGRGTSARTSTAVDKRCLINAVQAARLLEWIRRRPRGASGFTPSSRPSTTPGAVPKKSWRCG